MTYKELKDVIKFNTEASWEEDNIVEALELYVKGIVEQLESAWDLYEHENEDCVRGWEDALDWVTRIVKGGDEE